MKKVNIKDKNTLLIIKQGALEDQDTTVILNWTNRDMITGPKEFYRLHKKAGQQLYAYTIGFDNFIKPGDCLSTNPGQLDCLFVLHCIAPEYVGNVYAAFRNIKDTIVALQTTYKIKSLALSIKFFAEPCYGGVLKFLFDLGIEEIHIICDNKHEENQVYDFFKDYEYKKSRIDSINEKFHNMMIRLGNLKFFWDKEK